MNVFTNEPCVIERAELPAAFYEQHAEELALVGADAFGRVAEVFEPQVAERFNKAEVAQIMRCGHRIVGFALYDILRGSHWQRALY